MIDKELLRKRFERSVHSYNENAVIQQAMARRLVSLLADTNLLVFPRVLEIGSGTGLLTEQIKARIQFETFYANDLVADSQRHIERIIPESRFLPGDAEEVATFPTDLDLIISNATLQWLEDLDGFLQRMRELLKPGGLFAFSTFGPDNFFEIQKTSGESLSYFSYEQLTALGRKHFELKQAAQEQRTLYFSDPKAVLRHIHDTGVNANSHVRWGRADFRDFVNRYGEFHAPGKGYPLSYQPFYFVFQRRG